MALKNQYKYEWLGLLRDRWILVLSLILLAVCFYAAHNGKEKVAERQAPLEKAFEEGRAADIMYIALIDSVDQGLKPGLPVWQNPQRLNVIGQRAARVCAFEAQPLALVSTGQSDLFTHMVKPRLYGEALTLGFSELSNPVQLLFGSFDLAFVSIYLLPLLVLAFSYNVLSSEKESGTMRLTLVQPVGPTRWLFNKLLVRFIIISFVFIVAFLLSLMVAGVSVTIEIESVLKLIIAVLVYMLFWFGLSFWVNLRGKSSGSNAVVLVSLWVLLVLLVPAIISQLANSLYPVPSRVGMLTELRKAEADAQKKADEILSGYYRDHPELARTDTSEQSLYPFWLSYFASQEEIRKAVEPILIEYESKLQAQQRTVDKLRFFSPAVLLQNSFNELAGTSSRHYAAYRQQVVDFAGTWREFFVPRMFRNEVMKKEMVSELPQFAYNDDEVEQQFLADVTGLVLLAVGIFGLSLMVYRNQAVERILAV
jgi:ABC-2 type transport system permease protein